MGKERKIKILLILSVFFVPAFGQNLELDSMGMTVSDIEEIMVNQELLIDEDEQKTTEEMIEIIESESRLKDLAEEDFYDNEFGYSGREDFLVESRPKILNQPLKKFGYDYFINRPTTFATLSDIPIPPDYLIGPGDEIEIILYGNLEDSYSLRVTRDGDIYLPKIGPVSVAGQTFEDFKTTIKQIISTQLIGTEVNVTLGELRSINIFVLGEAAQPGMYTVSSLSTMTNAIFASGGIKTSGSLRDIQLKRNGKTISNFDLYGLLLRGDVSNDYRLMSGDILFIPPVKKTVAISGEVQRPGIYELIENETAQDLINYSGNFKAKSDKAKTEIRRINQDSGGFELILADLINKNASGLLLHDGDRVSVYPIEDRIQNAILIKGHHPKPGFYPWKSDMRLSDLIDSRNDLLPMTDMNYLLVQRKDEDDETYSFIHVDLKSHLKNPMGLENISLNNKDEITLFPTLSYCEIISRPKGSDSNQNNSIGLASNLDNQDNQILPEDEFPNSINQKINSPVYEDLGQTDLNSNDADELLMSMDSSEIKSLCRRELIDPLVELIKNSPNNERSSMLVRVSGNVLFPGQYPLTKNATVEDLVKAAGMFDELSYIDEIEITREAVNDKQVISSQIVNSFSSIKEMEVLPRDTITVKRISSAFETVKLEGEVYFPGEYIIQKGETLLNLISRAGGLTSQANASNLIFTREEIAEQQKATLEKNRADLQKQLLIIQAETNDRNDAGYLSKLESLTSTSEEEGLGRLVFSYEDIVNQKVSDVELRDGDMIFIPQDVQTVNVIGEVYAPNAHIFNSSYKVKDYILSSGGVNEFGDLSEAYVIKGDGSVFRADSLDGSSFFRNNVLKLEGGDTIVVPLEIKVYPGLQTARETTQIIYQLAVATAAIRRF